MHAAPTPPSNGPAAKPLRRFPGPLRLLHLGVFYTELALFGLGCLVYNVACVLSSLLPARRSRLRLHQWCGVAQLRFFLWMIDVSNLCKIERPNPDRLKQIGPSIVVANHTGLMDAIVLNTLFPRAACVFKSKLGDNPLFSHILRRGGHLRNDEGIDLIRKGAKAATTQGHVIVFPEGTRNQHSENFQFKKGFALMARRANLPVTLFAIHNSTHAFSREMGIRAPKLPFQLRFEVVGQLEIQPRESIDAFVERVESIYNRVFRHDELPASEIHPS